MFGYTTGTISSVEEWYKYAFPDAEEREHLRQLWNDRITTYKTSGIFLPIETLVVCTDGSRKTILFNYESVENLQITSLIDVSIQRSTEMALRVSEENYRTVADYTHDWEFWILPDGILQYISPSCERITGYSVKEFTKNPKLISAIVHPDDQAIIAEHTSVTMRASNLLEYRILTKDGKIRWIAHSCQPVYNNSGAYRGQRVNNRDTTELKHTQEQLRQSQKMHAIGQLAGGIAHDFNNILGGIIGYADLGRTIVETGGTIDTYFDKILQAGDRAKQLIRQILTFSRQGPEEKRFIYLKPLVKEAMALLTVSIPSTVTISINVQESSHAILADATKIHEILMNLASNSVYAMHEKGTLTVALYEEEITRSRYGLMGDIPPGQYCIIEIADTGMGMDDATLAQIFDPFFTTKPTGEGTGMGLSVVFGICQMHNTNIQVESTPGSGTTIRLLFPAVVDPVLQMATNESETLRRGTEHILLVG